MVTGTPRPVYGRAMIGHALAKRLRALLMGGLLLACVAPAVSGAQPALDDVQVERRVRKLSDELKSPYCPGKTLMTCTSYQAFELRREMADMVRSGQSDAEIVAILNDRFDNKVSNPPQPWYTFIVPFLPYVLGAVLILVVVRRWVRKDEGAAEAEPAVTPADDDRLARLRAQVAAYDDD